MLIACKHSIGDTSWDRSFVAVVVDGRARQNSETCHRKFFELRVVFPHLNPDSIKKYVMGGRIRDTCYQPYAKV